jgi:hypothetical protein
MPITENIDQSSRLAAIEWASKKLKYSIDRPDMNQRGLSDALDDKIMGDIATIAICQFIRRLELKAIAYDQIRCDNFELPDPGWDILVYNSGLALNNWRKTAQYPCTPPNEAISLSVRSSRLPKGDTLEKALNIRDFKIFDNHRGRIEKDLTSDIETQVYYELNKTQLNEAVSEEDINRAILSRDNCIAIDEKLNIGSRYDSCFLSRWDFSTNIIKYTESLIAARKKSTWPSYHGGKKKEMWIAPLNRGFSFKDAFQMIKN